MARCARTFSPEPRESFLVCHLYVDYTTLHEDICVAHTKTCATALGRLRRHRTSPALDTFTAPRPGIDRGQPCKTSLTASVIRCAELSERPLPLLSPPARPPITASLRTP